MRDFLNMRALNFITLLGLVALATIASAGEATTKPESHERLSKFKTLAKSASDAWGESL